MSGEVEDERDAPAVPTARELAERWMRAVNSCDEEAALAVTAPSFVYTTGRGVRYEGHQGVRDIVEDFARLAGLVSVDVLEVIDDGAVVAMHRVERYAVPGGVGTIPCCTFVEVTDGLVTRWTDHKNLGLFDRVADL